MYYLKVVYVFFLWSRFGSAENENPSQVLVGPTIFIGSVMRTWKGNSFSAFRGIKYAESPTDEMRFKDPKPIFQYPAGPYNASENGNDCPSLFAQNPSEDCLFLNIYTKNVPLSNTSDLHPVIAFIHPGGFYLGTGSSTFIGPDYLMEQDIILVTFNYRLGTLGFLNLGIEDYPGNAGLKDQVLALRWIRDYISYFGGNPNSVTLMGYSAGGFSVSLHLVSPMSQGLFQKAIIMSGSIPPQTNLPDNQINITARQAMVLGCKKNLNLIDIMICLNGFSGSQIAFTLRQMFDFGKDNPVFLWLPVIESDFGQERFLTEDPYAALQKGNFNRVPILTGFTQNEFCTSAVDILTNSTLANEFDANFDRLASISLMYSSAYKSNITQLLRKHYSLEGPLNTNHIMQLCNLFSDAIIRFGSHRMAQIASRFTDVYTYKFSYTGRYSNLYYPKGGDVLGAEHMDDLMYIFRNGPVTFTPRDPESVVVNLMTNLIGAFAGHGKPPQEFVNRWNFSKGNFAHITDKLDIKEGSNFDQNAFWDALFPL